MHAYKHSCTNQEANKRREREKKARKASKSDIVMALREEFDDAPMEESHHVKNLADDAVCLCVCVCMCA